jgi:peroxiredoxin
MKLYFITIPLSLALAGGGLLFYLRSQMAFGDQPLVGNAPKHPVSEVMRQLAEQEKNKVAPEFLLSDLEGKKWTRKDIQGGMPTFFYFVQAGCPCSIDVEPLFHALHKHLGGKVKFVPIIDSEPEKAKVWAQQNAVTYPMLCSPDASAMRAYKASQSVYSTLVDGNGKIIKQWPGYSQRLLKDMNATMSKLAGLEAKPFDSAYAPKEDSSGCAFALPEGER